MSDCRKLLCIIPSNRPWMSLHVSRDVYFLQVSSALTLLFLFVDNEALKISVWEAAVIAAQICPFPECNVLIIRKAWNWLNKNASRLPSIAWPQQCFHCTEVVGDDQMQYFSWTAGGTTCQWSGEVTEDLLLCLLFCGTPQGLGSSYSL